MCLITREAYGLEQRDKIKKDFLSYLGTQEAADWRLFTDATELYLSEAYRTCARENDKVKSCVRTGLDRIEEILINTQRNTPAQRVGALLSLSPPRHCHRNSASSNRDQNVTYDRAAWQKGEQRKYKRALESLSLYARPSWVRSSTGPSNIAFDWPPPVRSSSTSSADVQIMPRVEFNHGVLHYRLNDMMAAAKRFELGLKKDQDNARLNYGLALVQLHKQRFVDSMNGFERAQSGHPLDPESLSSLSLKINLGIAAAYRGQREFKKADDVLSKLVDAATKSLGAEHRVLGQLYYEWAWIRADRRGYGEAQKLLRKTLHIWRKNYDEVHPKILDAHIAMGLAQVEATLAEEALETLKKAKQINEKLGSDRRRTLEIQFILALAHADRDHYLDRAIDLASKTLFQLRNSEIKLPHLELWIQRWLEAI